MVKIKAKKSYLKYSRERGPTPTRSITGLRSEMDILSLSRALSRVAQARGHGGPPPPGASRGRTGTPVSSRGGIAALASHMYGGAQVLSRFSDLDPIGVCDGGGEEIGAGASGGGESGGVAHGVACGEGAASGSGGHGVGCFAAPGASTRSLSAVGNQTGGSTGEIQPSDRSDAANPTSSGSGCDSGADVGSTSTGCRSGGREPTSGAGGGGGSLRQARGGVEP
jgi:hypothetical protein